MSIPTRKYECITCRTPTDQVFVGKRMVETKAGRQVPFILWECLSCFRGNGSFCSQHAYDIFPDILAKKGQKKEKEPVVLTDLKGSTANLSREK